MDIINLETQKELISPEPSRSPANLRREKGGTKELRLYMLW